MSWAPPWAAAGLLSYNPRALGGPSPPQSLSAESDGSFSCRTLGYRLETLDFLRL